MEYEIPINSAYKYGPYMHSIQENYEQMSSSSSLGLLANQKTQELIGQLKSKIEMMKREEKKFYDLFGVTDAIEFSNVYLLNMGEKADPSSTISQKLLSVLNTPEVFTILTTPAENILPQLNELAQQVLLENPQIQQIAEQECEYIGLQTLLKALNKAKGANNQITLSINSTSINFKTPEREIKSLQSKYILDILSKVNPIIIESLRRDYISRIKKVLKIFDEKKALFGVEYDFYRNMLEKHLMGAAGLDQDYLDEKNLSLFGNFASAEGGMFEIILTLGLTPSKQYSDAVLKQNTMLANNVVSDFKRKYRITSDESGGEIYILTTKKGEKWRVNYKSPTDLILQDINGTFYSLQLKNTLSDIKETSLLKLQGTIQLPTFLANVSNVLSSTDTLNLLIYHIVNQSNFPGGNGLQFINNILSACVEYYVESRYLRDLTQNIDNLEDATNMGNMFMIYSGYLVPISAFVEYAIQQIESEGSIVFNENGFFNYGTTYGVNELIGKTFEERVNMGKIVYNNTIITQINVAIGQILNYMGAFNF